MKKTLILATASLAAALAAALAPAAFAQPFTDNARVVSSAPVFERIPIQREECWNERERGYRERRVTRSDTGAPIGPGTVLGAIVGGVAGHQVGRGRGNDAATAAGAVVGGLLGNQYDRDRDGPPDRVTEVERVPVERDVQRCRTVDEVREATVGYDVRYEYRGRQFTTRLPQDPGRTLPVEVEVRPLPMRDAPPPPPPPPGPRAPSYR